MSQITVGTVNVTSGLQLPSFTTANRPAGSQGLMIFNSTEKVIQSYIDGSWVNVGSGGKKTVEFKLWGAGGGGGSQNRNNTGYLTTTEYYVKQGGAGGFVTASFKISSGTALIFSVGQGGKGALQAGNPSSAAGGYNGGGAGSYSSYDASGGGGGYSGVFIGSKSQGNALVIAPGGGGGAGGPGYPGNSNDQGNGGGGINTSNGTGNQGALNYNGTSNAGGGTPTAGGAAGAGGGPYGAAAGAAGSALQGANAVYAGNAWGSGGGGGGGWYGGGSGASDGNAWTGGGGGAGSAFVRESGIATTPTNSDILAVEYSAHTFGLQTYGRYGDGNVYGSYNAMRMPVGTTDAQYPGSNIGYGATMILTSSVATPAYNGNDGAIVYRIDGGSWTTLFYSGSDVTITI